MARLNIRNADIHKAADLIRVGGDAERYCRLIRSGPAPDVDNEPRIRDLNVPRRTLAIASAQNATAEDPFIEIGRSVDVGDGDKMCDGEPVVRGHLIVLLVDLYAAHLLMWVMVAGIQTTTTTDWLPNAGIAPSCQSNPTRESLGLSHRRRDGGKTFTLSVVSIWYSF